MAAFKDELLTVLKRREESFTDYIVSSAAMPIPNAAEIPPADLRQMVAGFWMLVREAIAGESRELRDMYFTTVFPGLRDSGTNVVMMVGGSARVLFHVLAEMTPLVSEPNRAQAQEWMVQFFSDYLAEMASVWAR